jgi:hypothetical protein
MLGCTCSCAVAAVVILCLVFSAVVQLLSRNNLRGPLNLVTCPLLAKTSAPLNPLLERARADLLPRDAVEDVWERTRIAPNQHQLTNVGL